MPEGHVVHRQARSLARMFKGSAISASSPQGRFAADAAVIDGSVLRSTDAYGKHLLMGFDEGTVHVHLGLYGKWTFGKGLAPEPRGLIRLRLQGEERYADLRGPTACRLLTDAEVDQLVARIGPDPIRRDADPERAWARVHSSRAAIGGLLMQQEVFAGVGNIYRAEALFRAGISPFRMGRDVSRREFDELWADLVVLMRAGVSKGRIDTVRTEHLPVAMGRAPRRDRHGGEVYVYRRAGQECFVCDSEIAWTDMQGRNLFWCEVCQAV